MESDASGVNEILAHIGTAAPLWLSTFLTPLEVTPLEDGVNWRVEQAFDFESVVLQAVIAVPAGFVTDFASIPRALWTIVGAPTGKYTRAAVVHDLLYRTPTILCTRALADNVLYEAMVVSRVEGIQRWAIYRGVRLGGGSSFKIRTA